MRQYELCVGCCDLLPLRLPTTKQANKIAAQSAASVGRMTRLELVEGKSAKYWEAKVSGKVLTTSWGRIGTAGQSKRQSFASSAAAAAACAKLVDAKKRKGYRDAGEPKPQKSSQADALVALGTALAKKDPAGLEKELRLAVDRPSAYFTRYRNRLDDRGIEGPDDTYATTLPLLALIDGLIARKSLAEIDWREEPEDALSELKKVHGGLLSKHDFSWGKSAAGMRTDAFLAEAARRFSRDGVQLAIVDMRSDSYPLVVFPVRAKAQIEALARSA